MAAVITILAVTLLFAHLGKPALHFDEAIYAQLSKETVQLNDWLTPHWNGRTWFQKSPAYFWITALFFKAFGATEFWARFPSALSGLGVLLLSFLIARRLYNATAGVLAVLILLSSQLFVYYARFGGTDTMLTFFIVLAVYAYLRTAEDERYWVLAAAGCAMALMVKGPAGVVAPAGLGITVAIDRRFASTVRSKWLWIGVGVAVAIVAPWHLLMYQKHGDAFITGYIITHVINRAKTNLNEFQRGYGFYFTVLKDFFSPWVYILPFGLIFSWRARSLVMLVLGLFVFVLYTLAQTKFQWYILPAIPAFAVITAGFVTQLSERRTQHQLAIGMSAFILLWAVGTFRVVRLIKTVKPEIESAARLARMAAHEPGGIVAYPEHLEMTVMFYSGRKLCTDPVISKLSHNEVTECEPTEPRHVILRTADRNTVESRFTIDSVREDGPITYASIVRR
jgi:4-amino-4-deoxy-L-arabinose transferase-like glycosyltransferase